MRILLAPALLVVGLVACSSPDITGVYQTKSSAFDTMTCEAKTSTPTPAFFVVREGELFGVTLNSVRGCTSASLDDCDGAGPDTFARAPLTLGTSDGWEGAADVASGFGMPCAFGHAEVKVVQGDDLSLTITAFVRELETNTTTCDTDHVPEDMPCTEAQTITGARVADAPPSDGLTL